MPYPPSISMCSPTQKLINVSLFKRLGLTYIYYYYVGEGNGTALQYSCLENPMDGGAWWAAVHGVAKSQTRLSNFTLTFHFHALEKEMATHSSVLAWRIPGMGEPGGLPSMGLQRVRHDWSYATVLYIFWDTFWVLVHCRVKDSCPLGRMSVLFVILWLMLLITGLFVQSALCYLDAQECQTWSVAIDCSEQFSSL